MVGQPAGSLFHALAWHALQEYVDISGTRMSCCDNQSQADEGPTLPPFLQFSKRFMQFDLNSPRGSARMLDETGEEASSQPNNILWVPAVLWGFHKSITGSGAYMGCGPCQQQQLLLATKCGP